MKVLALLLVVYVASTTGCVRTGKIWTAEKACQIYHYVFTEDKVLNKIYPAERDDNVEIEFIEPQLNYDTIVLKPESSSSTGDIFEITYGLYKYENAVESDSSQTKRIPDFVFKRMPRTAAWMKEFIPQNPLHSRDKRELNILGEPSGNTVIAIPSNERPTATISVSGVEYTLPLQAIVVGFTVNVENNGITPSTPFYAGVSLQFTRPGDPPNKFYLNTFYYQSIGKHQDSNVALRQFVEAIKPGRTVKNNVPVPVDLIPVHSSMIQEIIESFTERGSAPIYYWKGLERLAGIHYEHPVYIGLAPCPYTSFDIEKLTYSLLGTPQGC